MKSPKIHPIVDKLTRVKSNRMTLRINKYQQVCVSAPQYISIQQINAFVEKNLEFINEKKKVVAENQPQKLEFKNGEKVLYLGELREIEIIAPNRNAIQYRDGKFYLSENCINYGEFYFEQLFKNLAWNYLVPKTYELAEKYNFKVAQVKINKAKTNWGSCSNKNNINYSWRLIMAPTEAIDYVIIHELCHTVIKNHKREFWQLVAEYCPQYKNQVRWLKENSKYCNV